MSHIQIMVEKLRPNAIIPESATKLSGGLDLHACIDEPVTIPVGEIVTIPCGIAICPEVMDENIVMFVMIRSSLGKDHGLTLANSVGVVDSDYRGEILVPIINHGTEDYTLEPGERFAQLVPVPMPDIEISEAFKLPKSDRVGGFGSTGKF